MRCSYIYKSTDFNMLIP